MYSYSENEKEKYIFDEIFQLIDEKIKDLDAFNRSFFYLSPKTMKLKTKDNNDLVLLCIVKVKNIGGVKIDRLSLYLLDTVSINTLIQWQVLPFECKSRISVVKQVTTTAMALLTRRRSSL